MKFFHTIVFIFFLSKTFSQYYEVSYNYTFNSSFKDSNNKEMAGELSKVEGILTFDKNKSNYTVNYVKNDSHNSLLISALSSTKIVLYTDRLHKDIIKSFLMGDFDNVIVRDSFVWNLLDEYKTINGLKCQKATGSKYTKGYKNVAFYEAWFCLDLPVSIGPRGIRGLPGLIVQLKDRHFVLTAEYIKKLESTKVKFSPTSGKFIDGEEHADKARKFAKDRRGN